jgi:hypothetical protein
VSDTPSAPDPQPAFIRRVGPNHIVVVGTPAALAMLGRREASVPANMTQALRTAAVAAPAFSAIAEQLTGGLVRLTAHSRALLAQHGPTLAQEGGVLGVVQGADGKFAGVLAFEDAGRLANIGLQLPALAGAIGLQLQLVAIERKLGEIQSAVDALIRDGQIEVLAESRAALDIMRDVYLDAIETGELTDDDWARATAVELPVRRLHEQASAQLRWLDTVLASPDAGVGERLRALGEATRHDRARFWLEAYIVAESALTRWEAVRLIRLSVTDDARLWRELEQSRTALEQRRDFLRGLADHLGAYLVDAGRVDGLLDRFRLIRRARLDRLILELDRVLEVYRTWVPDDDVFDQPTPDPTLVEGQQAALPEPAPAFDWGELVRVTRKRSGALIERTGTLAGDAATVVGRSATRAIRAGREVIRRDGGSPDEGPD